MCIKPINYLKKRKKVSLPSKNLTIYHFEFSLLLLLLLFIVKLDNLYK